MLGALLMLIGPTTLGAWIARRLLGAGGRPVGLGLALSVGVPTGFGLASVALFLASQASVSRALWRWLDLGLTGLALVFAVRFLARAARARGVSPPGAFPAATPAPPPGVRALERGITVALLLAVLATLTAIVAKSLLCAHGDWDGWAIWNMHARFIYRDPGLGLRYLHGSLGWTHPDYPLLLPLAVVRGWSLGGGESVLVPMLLGPLFLGACAGLLYFGLVPTHGSPHARLAVLVLLSAPVASLNAAAQTADLPLACYVLCSTTCMLVGARSDAPGAFALAGLSAALAAWTKSEGLFLAPALLVGGLAPLVSRDLRGAVRRTAAMIAGLAPLLGALAVLWLRVGGFARGILAELPWDVARGNLTAPDRYWSIAARFATEPARISAWAAAPWLALLAPLALGRIEDSPLRRPALQAGLVLALLHAAHFGAYVLIPGDLVWYLDSSLERLLLHGFPSVILALLALARPWPPR